MNKNQTKVSNSKKVAIAVGTGVLVAGTAMYLLFGPKGKKNSGKVKSWAVQMEKDIVKKLSTAKDLSIPAYNEIIDQIKEKYGKVKNLDNKELSSVLADLRKHWIAITKIKRPRTGK